MKDSFLFSSLIINWSTKNDRLLPWKQTNDPYKIWLSEIILQQTRIDQGTPYYLKFITEFPTVNDLAKADEDEVLKLWQGLGYYSRARNLHFTAKYIANELNGVFPTNHKDILKLKGIGDYTAAAIASFAYGLPHAVVDGNVYRVLSRVFGIETPIDSTQGKKEFSQLASELLDYKRPAANNQAIMDFGALQCTPKSPDCENCPLKDFCIAFNTKKIDQLPVKQKKLIKKNRYFHYLVINIDESVFLNKRNTKDIWQGLYDFPLIEHSSLLSTEELKDHPEWKAYFEGTNIEITSISKPFKQTLSHQYIHAVFYEIMIKKTSNNSILTHNKVRRAAIDQFAFPKIITWFLSDKTLYLGFK